MTRSTFSERKVIATLLGQGAVIPCYRCRKAFTEADAIEREHLLEIALGGENTPDNCRFSHKKCHAIVTNGTPATSAGSSKHRIAHTNRLRNPKKSKGTMRSRPFGKRANPAPTALRWDRDE